MTLHTLRHSFASIANELGYTESTIAAMLGHSLGSTTSRYVHHLDTVLIAAAGQVSQRIEAAMAPHSDLPNAKVIALHTN